MKIVFLISFIYLSSCSSRSWKDSSRESSKIAIPAKEMKEDIFQVYYARAYSWRGYLGVHPWVAWKLRNEKEYKVAQVTSWNLRRTGETTISVVSDIPDRIWFDNKPTLLHEVKGEKARSVIKKAIKLIKNYPYKKNYTLWPGPNSNTFIAYLIRHIDELEIELPPHAIGKDYFTEGKLLQKSSSGTGFQFSLYGLLGLTLGAQEGIEVNFLGLNFGLDFWTPAIKVPFIGRLGFPEGP